MRREYIDHLTATTRALPDGLVFKIAQLWDQDDWAALDKHDRLEIGRWAAREVEEGRFDWLELDHIDRRNHRVYVRRPRRR